MLKCRRLGDQGRCSNAQMLAPPLGDIYDWSVYPENGGTLEICLCRFGIWRDSVCPLSRSTIVMWLCGHDPWAHEGPGSSGDVLRWYTTWPAVPGGSYISGEDATSTDSIMTHAAAAVLLLPLVVSCMMDRVTTSHIISCRISCCLLFFLYSVHRLQTAVVLLVVHSRLPEVCLW